jgi:hypothetical protein
MSMRAAPLTERIERMSTRTESGCWEWSGYRGHDGYGRVNISRDGRRITQSAHRVSYEAFVGTIPGGLHLDHLCRNRACVNPAHLEPVTNRENLRRSPLTLPTINAAKTHCPQGHEYSGANLGRRRDGSRICRACHREEVSRSRARRRRERAA